MNLSSYLYNWNWVRVFRLLLGISVLGTGLQSGMHLLSLLGLVLLVQGLFNRGCEATCAPDLSPSDSEPETFEGEVEYEVIQSPSR